MIRLFSILLVLCLNFLTVNAQNGFIVDDSWLASHYTKKEVMITMRDSSRLYTAIYQPKLSDECHPAPVMLFRTPYSLKPYGEGYNSALKGEFANYVADSYVIVMQNVRGKYLSEGIYENMRPYLNGNPGVDEATDTYDTVDWIMKNIKTNGNVGVKGVSYPGFYAVMAALSRHPAIKAVSPQAPATDWFMGDDAHHNGAFCLTDTYRFGSSFYRERRFPSKTGLSSLVNIDTDIYSYFTGKPFSELSAFFGDSLRFWNEMMAHPDYDSFWKQRDPSVHLKDISPAVLVVGGFYDAEDCYGAFRTYERLKSLSSDSPLYLAAGPWYHGAWNNRGYNHLAEAWFGENSGKWYQDKIEYPFFSFYLEGKGLPPEKVNILPSSETMRDRKYGTSSDPDWRQYDSWPPETMRYTRVMLSASDSLSFNPCRGRSLRRQGAGSFVSDPASPVPYMGICGKSRDRGYMVSDQRFAADREDVLSYSSGTLDDTLYLAGPVKVSLDLILDAGKAFEADNPDADIVVKIIDVRPDGYHMLVRGDIMPLRFRNGFEKAIPAKAGKPVNVSFNMCDVAHVLLPGHSLMIQIQSSWFPLFAMNPQTFLPNPYRAVADDYRKVKVSVLGSSWIELPVAGY